MGPTDFLYNIGVLLEQMRKLGVKAEIVSAGPTEITLKKMGAWTSWIITWNAWGGMASVDGQNCTFKG